MIYHRLLVLLSSLVGSYFCQVEFRCKPQPGCEIAQCHQSGSWRRESSGLVGHLVKKEFPITCTSSGDDSNQQSTKGFREELDALKEELAGICKKDKMQEKEIAGLTAGMIAISKKVNKLRQAEHNHGDEIGDLKIKGVGKTCPEVEKLTSRKAKCSKQNSVDSECTFSCVETHQIVGQEKVLCRRNGTWSAELPTCRLRKCDDPPSIEHGRLKCSDANHTVGSSCTVECHQNRAVQDNGHNQVTCLRNEEWSQSFPSCSCRRCATGENCEHSTSWKSFQKQITDSSGDFKAIYGGRAISCSRTSSFYSWKFVWKCRCRDVTSDVNLQCRRKSPLGSCEHATAELIRLLAGRKVYPEPCDRAEMKQGCNG